MLLFSFPPSLSSFLFLPFPPYSLFFFFFFLVIIPLPLSGSYKKMRPYLKKARLSIFLLMGVLITIKVGMGFWGLCFWLMKCFKRCQQLLPLNLSFIFMQAIMDQISVIVLLHMTRFFPFLFFSFLFFSFLFYLFYFSFPFDKRAIKKYALKTHKWISDGDDLVEALGELKGNYFSTTLEVNFFVSPIIS